MRSLQAEAAPRRTYLFVQHELRSSKPAAREQLLHHSEMLAAEGVCGPSRKAGYEGCNFAVRVGEKSSHASVTMTAPWSLVPNSRKTRHSVACRANASLART